MHRKMQGSYKVPTNSYQFLKVTTSMQANRTAPRPVGQTSTKPNPSDPLGRPVPNHSPSASLQTGGHPCYLQNGWADQYPPTPVGRNSKKKIHPRYPLRRPQKRSKSLKKQAKACKNNQAKTSKNCQKRAKSQPAEGCNQGAIRVQLGCN